jgi:hypothetical protein
MDDTKFDDLSKETANSSRRRVLKVTAAVAVGGALSAVKLGSASAAQKRKNGVSCRQDSDCLSDFCGSWDEKHHRGICQDYCPW